jgi:RNA polymerase sigma factor (sigma-70 family)
VEASALTNTSSMSGLRGPSPLLRLQSDERLIAMTRRGQHAAFEVLFSRYQSRLLSFCRHMLGSREDAEDVLQEVFTAAFNAVLGDEREINVRPWLYRIARNRSLNHLRRASAIGVDSMDVHFSDHGLSTGDRVIKRESFRQLLADVQDLPETQRTALLLREIDALSYEQIAHAMETTVPSVKSLLVRARISLAEAAEARKLNCAEVRLELGETAEGLTKLGAPARRHVRGCENCRFFKKQLKENNHALAAILPVGPLLLLKKLLLTKLGSTASAGSAHVAGSAGATVGAGAGAAASAGAVGGASTAGSVLTVGAGAIATKAVAGLAAAAIVTAGAVAAEHTGRPAHRHHPGVSSRTSAYVPSARTVDQPVVVQATPQPISSGVREPVRDASAAAKGPAHHLAAVALHSKKAAIDPASTAPAVTATPVADATAPVTKPVAPKAPPLTQVTTESTELPPQATAPPPDPPPAETVAAATTTTPSETPPPVSSPPVTSAETSTTPSETPPSAPVPTASSEPPAPPPVSSTPQVTPASEGP